MHRYLHTDNGLQCYRCGIVLDYRSPDDATGHPFDQAGTTSAYAGDPLDACYSCGEPKAAHTGSLEDAAVSLAFGLCREPDDARAHHYVLEGIPPHVTEPGETDTLCSDHDYRLVCAYDGVTVDADTLPADVPYACTGA
jgi:hypothetical protein